VEVLGSLEETREMELYTGADEIQIQVRMRGIMHIDCAATVPHIESQMQILKAPFYNPLTEKSMI
jgi:hypothetical protein